MATKYSGSVKWNNDKYESVALFSDSIVREVLIDWVDSTWAYMEDLIKQVYIQDMETGEIIYQREDWDNLSSAYLESYTDDC